jgi:hypothetical protein
MSLFLAFAAAAATAQPASPPAQPRPIACLYDRLDRAYLGGLWKRVIEIGIPNDDPSLANFDAAGLACQQQHGWPDKMVGLAGYYAMARAYADAMLQEKLAAQADRDLLVRMVQTFAPGHLDVLDRDGEGEFASAAKVEFRAFLTQADPELLRRIDYEDLWSAAMPRLVAEIFHAQFAFARDLG